MVILILLALFALPQQSSKVVVNTGVPEAEFFLDATFIAATDQNGTLTMEDFPAGTFKFTIKKRGYKAYNGSFTIREGEAKLLQPVLEKLEIPDRTERQTPIIPSRSELPVKQTHKADTIPPVAEMNPPIPLTEFPSNEAAEPQPVKQIPQRKPKGSLILPVLAFLIATVLLVSGLWSWKKRQKAQQKPFPDSIVDIEDPEFQSGSLNRPEPLFIEQLKRREEQLKAGFVGNRSPHINPESMKEKEVVIVLPKDAYRYEEDK